jgi:ATP-binding protein involved in chromosome partitioning
MMVNTEQVRHALQGVIDPELNRNLIELGMVRQVDVTDGFVTITLALTTLDCPLSHRIVDETRQAVFMLNGVRQVDVVLEEMSAEEKQRVSGSLAEGGQVAQLNDIRYVLAVMSGKGGVGKSLVSSLLAVALRCIGHQVGILDADITGPSIPKMFFNAGTRLNISPTGLLLPAQSRTGIGVMSINLLLESEDQAVIWRGPLIGRAIQQFWGDVLWGSLDYLVVDLPPGTSDASLTVMQSLPLSGVVLVTSPQDLAGMVVRKAAQMTQVMKIPVIGLIENMSYFVCPDTGKRYDLFGMSHAETMATQLGIPFLGRLPIDPEIARLCDAGLIEDYPIASFMPMAERVEALASPARQPIFGT